MPESNHLYELTRLMDDKETMESDLSEILGNIQNMLQKKYIKKVHNAVDFQQQQINSNPPREVKLMRALRDFTPKDRRSNLDSAIEMLSVMNTAQSMQKELQTIAQTSNNSDISLSGVKGGIRAMEDDNRTQAVSTNAITVLLTLALMKII